MTLEAIKYTRGSLKILDQLKLPHQTEYVDIKTSKDGYVAILNMVVRGAPAIAIVAALSLAVQLYSMRKEVETKNSIVEIQKFIENELDYLNKSRPTAVNLSDAIRKLKSTVKEAAEREGVTALNVLEAYTIRAEEMMVKDVEDNKNIGRFGSDWLSSGADKISVLTHCNTG